MHHLLKWHTVQTFHKEFILVIIALLNLNECYEKVANSFKNEENALRLTELLIESIREPLSVEVKVHILLTLHNFQVF